MALIGAFLARALAWFLQLLGAGEAQKQADQIAKDADEIQSLKDMGKIQDTNASLSADDIMQQLRTQTSARRPPA